MPVDFDKLTPENFEELASQNKSDVYDMRFGEDGFAFSMGVIINIVRELTGKLDAIAHVKPNPHEWENRYYAGNAEMERSVFYNTIYGRSDNLNGTTGDKIPELYVNLFNKAYNYMNPNTRIGENLKVRDSTPLVVNGDKLTLSNILNGFPDMLRIRQWVDANFSKYFDSNMMCIMPCQIGCQVGCQVAQQLPSDYGNDTCSNYPSNLGINGFHYAYPGRYYDWYPGWATDKIHVVNTNLNQDEGPYYTYEPKHGLFSRRYSEGWYMHRYRRRYTNVFGAATKEIRDKIKEYNKERERFNRAQIGKNPCVWKPYYSVIWLSFVLPISEEWLDSDKLVENSLAHDRNGAHNYYRNIPDHANWSRNGRYLFVRCENDYLITPNTDNKFEKYQAKYYEYIKYPARNDHYRLSEEELEVRRRALENRRDSFDDCSGCNNK